MALHGDGIYYESGDRTLGEYVRAFDCELESRWRDSNDVYDFSGRRCGELEVNVCRRPKTFTLALRRPSWAGDGFDGEGEWKELDDVVWPGSYVELKRTWKTGDSVSLVCRRRYISKVWRTTSRAALMWGPLVLAGDLGPERRGGPAESSASLVTAEKPLTEWLQPVPDNLGVFRTVGVGRSRMDRRMRLSLFRSTGCIVALIPSTGISTHTTVGPKSWTELKAEKARQQKLEAATVAFVQPGDPEKEKQF